MPFFILFFIIPLTEIALFVKIGGALGLGTTLLLCVLTAALGAILIRRQGLHTLLSARTAMDRGGMPFQEIFDGLCLAVAGALLMTPGFLTDAIGFSLLTPPIRHVLRTAVARHFKTGIWEGRGDAGGFGSAAPPDVIEAEFERLDDDPRRRSD